MALCNKSAYIDFTTNILGIQTAIKIFETETNFFVYINQNENEMHLYNDIIQNTLQRSCKSINGKKITVICNLANHESLQEIINFLIELIND